MALGSKKLLFIIFFLTIKLIILLGYLLFIKNPNTNNTSINLVISREVKTEKIIDNEAIIAIILTDFGIIKSLDELSKTLPTEINFGISPYNLSKVDTSDIKNNILFNIPLSSAPDETNPSLESNMPENINSTRLDKFLFSAKKFQGIYTDGDEIFTKNITDAVFFLSHLQKENIIYLSSIQDLNANIYKVAEKIGFHILTNNVNLDEILSSEAIGSKLQELENIAKKKGFAIAMGSNYSLTIDSLKKWLPSLANKNIRLVSVEDFYKMTYYTYTGKSVYNRELLDNLK